MDLLIYAKQVRYLSFIGVIHGIHGCRIASYAAPYLYKKEIHSLCHLVAQNFLQLFCFRNQAPG